jgi:hypothetical protein
VMYLLNGRSMIAFVKCFKHVFAISDRLIRRVFWIFPIPTDGTPIDTVLFHKPTSVLLKVDFVKNVDLLLKCKSFTRLLRLT